MPAADDDVQVGATAVGKLLQLRSEDDVRVAAGPVDEREFATLGRQGLEQRTQWSYPDAACHQQNLAVATDGSGHRAVRAFCEDTRAGTQPGNGLAVITECLDGDAHAIADHGRRQRVRRRRPPQPPGEEPPPEEVAGFRAELAEVPARDDNAQRIARLALDG